MQPAEDAGRLDWEVQGKMGGWIGRYKKRWEAGLGGTRRDGRLDWEVQGEMGGWIGRYKERWEAGLGGIRRDRRLDWEVQGEMCGHEPRDAHAHARTRT